MQKLVNTKLGYLKNTLKNILYINPSNIYNHMAIQLIILSIIILSI